MTDPVRNAMTQARRRQILQAAVDVFGEKGYHKATIKDIARTAGIADGTIYNYFKNKQDLMMGIVTQLAAVGQLMEDVDVAIQTMTPTQLLEMVFHNRLRTLKNNLPLARAIFPQIITDPELRQMFLEKLLIPSLEKGEQVFQTYIDQRQLKMTDPRIIVRGLFSVVFGTMMLAILGDTFLLSDDAAFGNEMTELFAKWLQADQPETDA